jgi:5-methyltetrahydrofolate--homocysteine methyltransferase
MNDASQFLNEIIENGYLKAKGAFGIFPANAVGDDVMIYSDDFREHPIQKLNFLRNQEYREKGKPNLCLADFIAPVGYPDHLGLFAVTAGIGAKERAHAYAQGGDDYRSFMILLLADRLAEAFAEYLHYKVRTEFWGYAKDESLDISEMITGKYQGIRPAPGYPACPDHSEKAGIFDLLQLSNDAEIKLTENCMMDPAASVCGYYFAHPQAKYFRVDEVQTDQELDYSRRKKQSITDEDH